MAAGEVDRVRVYLFRSEQEMLDAYFAHLPSKGVEYEGPYHPTLPDDEATYPYRSGCFVDGSRRSHHVFTVPPFVSSEVIGRDCDTVARWAWRGNADTPGAPTVWR